MTQINLAAVVTGSKEPSKVTEVESIPIPEPNENEILIKTIAYAFNPTDWKSIYQSAPIGSIGGTDASGVVEKVGSKVKGFQKGDYVSAFIHGNSNQRTGAFAKYAISNPQMTIKYSHKFQEKALKKGVTSSGIINTFEGAASVTLGLTTVGLSFAGNLQISPQKKNNIGKFILVWGGATATGVLAIQVAKLVYGIKVVTTASPKNSEFLKRLGAEEVFDYHDSESLKGLTQYDFSYVLDTISYKETFQASYDATKNSKDVKFDNLLRLGENDIEKDDRSGSTTFVPPTLAYLAVGHDLNFRGVQLTISQDTFERYKHFWYELLPDYISEINTSNLKVLEPGFESVNEGLELLKNDKVSAEKVVFRS